MLNVDQQKEQQRQAHQVRGITWATSSTKEEQEIVVSTKEEQGARTLTKDY